ncbi:MAG: HD-like signal output (HDOD) protein [Oceanospirillaceae bacterium]|jgi:HD-like signal output (HDOD) protein
MADVIITSFEDKDEKVLYGLDAWAQYLSIRDLPVRASTLKRLQKLLRSDRSTVQQLSTVVRKDPVLTLYVVRAAQLKHNENDSAVKSILHAVTSLGYDGIEQIAQQVKPISLNPTNVQQKRFLHAIATSHHAASQLHEWMLHKKLPLVEESYLAALFYSVGFWSLWLHAPLHMQIIQKRIHELDQAPIAVENHILGCSMQMISQRLSNKWQLSELTQAAQDHSTSPSTDVLKKLHRRAIKDPNLSREELRKLNHITHEKYFPIKLANWIALTASRNWYSEQTMHNMDLISDYLGNTPEKTMAMVHKICAKSSRDYFAPGIMSPACQLLFIQSDIQAHYKMGVKEVTANQSKYPIPDTPMIRPINLLDSQEQYLDADFYRLIERHLLTDKENSKLEKAAQILQALLQGLIKGLGIPRIALLSINPKNNTLKTIQSSGFDDRHPVQYFQANLAKTDLLAGLCRKQSYIVYDKISAKKLDSRLDDNLKQISSEEFMLISIFKASQPIALLYLDIQGEIITNSIRERAKHLCYCASTALKNLL